MKKLRTTSSTFRIGLEGFPELEIRRPFERDTAGTAGWRAGIGQSSVILHVSRCGTASCP